MFPSFEQAVYYCLQENIEMFVFEEFDNILQKTLLYLFYRDEGNLRLLQAEYV